MKTLGLTMQTNRVLLRELSLDMLPFLVFMYAQPSVREYLGGSLNQEQALARAKAYLDDADDCSWIIYNSLNQPIGLISIGKHHDSDNMEISYQLHPDFWGQGYATEAVFLVLDYSFMNLELPFLLAETQTKNIRSIKLLNQFGFIEKLIVQRFGEHQTIFSLSSECYKASVATSKNKYFVSSSV